jgi:hypothetical protein
MEGNNGLNTQGAAPRVDVAQLISAGVLASVCPRALIEEVLADTGRASQRERLLPAPAVLYYVMALALWREAPMEDVLRVVCEGLQWLGGGQAEAVQASKSVISQACTRLGPEVMRQLADRVLRPLAAPGAPGAWYGGREMSLDGSRGRFNPRGVKRKMSNFNVRHRGAALHQKHQPMPVLRI